MKSISIISASVREGRKSHRVALYFKNYLEENKIAKVKMIDLKSYSFPIFEERLSNIKNPSKNMIAISNEITSADGIIIVTPEYNGGYPASLKNVIDLLYKEWKRKPIAISTVSDGDFGGTQVITSLQFSLWKIGALVVPVRFPVPTVDKSFDKDGVASDAKLTDKRANVFINELMWWVKATQKMDK